MAKASINIDITDQRVQTSAASIGRLSKEQEIELVKALARQLPDSYFKDTLRHIEIQFENDTRSDFPCIPNLALIEQQLIERDKERSALIVQIEQLQEDKKNIRQELRRLRHIASETSKLVNNEAQTLMNWARSLNRAINELGEQGS